jgi:hypothetical protein
VFQLKVLPPNEATVSKKNRTCQPGMPLSSLEHAAEAKIVVVVDVVEALMVLSNPKCLMTLKHIMHITKMNAAPQVLHNSFHYQFVKAIILQNNNLKFFCSSFINCLGMNDMKITDCANL